MKKLAMIVVTLAFAIGFFEISREIKKANFQQILHRQKQIREIVRETTPEIFSRTRKFMKDRLILKDGCVIIFGSGNIKEKLRIAYDILKKDKNVIKVDLSTPGYAIVKNRGKK